MRFAWISEQTAIISLYSINLSVFITEAECLLRGTNWVFKSDGYSFVLKGLHWISFIVMTRPRIIWILNVAYVIFTSLFIGMARGGSRFCGGPLLRNRIKQNTNTKLGTKVNIYLGPFRGLGRDPCKCGPL